LISFTKKSCCTTILRCSVENLSYHEGFRDRFRED
jgi:hypothetical protein